MKDKNLKQILKRANEVSGHIVDIPDMSNEIKRIAKSASFPKDFERRNYKMETKKRTKLWAWLVPVTACLVAGIICAAIILPGLFNKENGGEGTVLAATVNSKYIASPSATKEPYETDRIKYSYSYNDDEGKQYDFYYIHLGQLQGIPIYTKGTYYHTGNSSHSYSFTTSKESSETIGKSATTASSEVSGIVKENTVVKGTTHTVAEEIGITVGFEAGMFGGKLSVEGSYKRTAEDAFMEETSNTTSNKFERTTSLEDTVSCAKSYMEGETETWQYNLAKEDPTGYYRFVMFSVSDVYLYIIKEADVEGTDGLVYYEFKEQIVPNSLTWKVDYSKSEFFKKENDTRFELDLDLLSKLPEPKVHLGGGSKPGDDVGPKPGDLDELFAYPDSSSLTGINGTLKNVFTVVLPDSTADNNKEITIPANIQVLNIKGVSTRTYTGVLFKTTAGRTSKLILNLWDFKFTAPNSSIAINTDCDLELNILGNCSITGGEGSHAANSNGGAGGTGIKAGNLTITGFGSLNVTGGMGGYGSGYTTTYAVGEYWYSGGHGGNGGIGINCISLISDIHSLSIAGGMGGSGAMGPYNPAGSGGQGGSGNYGIQCETLKNNNTETAITVKGGNGGNGGASGGRPVAGNGGYGGQAIWNSVVSVIGLVNTKDGDKGNKG